MRNYIYILLLLFSLCVLSSCQSTPSTSQAPTPTIQARIKLIGTPVQTALDYYHALKKQDYNKAYSYMAANATTPDGQKLTHTTFMQSLNTMNSVGGPIIDYSAIPDSSHFSEVIMTVTRQHGLRYHAHLSFAQQGDAWKIVSFDRI